MFTSTFNIVRGSVGYMMIPAAMSLRGQYPLYAANDYTFNFALVSSTGVAVDLTSVTSIVFIAKYSVDDTDGEAIFSKSCTINTPKTAGTFYVVFSPTTVPGPQAAYGLFEIQMTIGTVVETIVSGEIEFLPHI